MTSYNTFAFDSIQCEEQIDVTPEEMEEVMREMAEEAEAYKALGGWSEEVEKPWLNGYSNRLPGPKAGCFDI